MARKIVGVPTSGATDAATKGYVDTAVATSLLVPSIAKTTSYTLALADTLGVNDITSATAVTVTIPTNATVAIASGVEVEFAQQGAGQVTITPASGVTIHAAGNLSKTRLQYSSVSLRKLSTDVWHLVGDMA